MVDDLHRAPNALKMSVGVLWIVTIAITAYPKESSSVFLRAARTTASALAEKNEYWRGVGSIPVRIRNQGRVSNVHRALLMKPPPGPSPVFSGLAYADWQLRVSSQVTPILAHCPAMCYVPRLEPFSQSARWLSGFYHRHQTTPTPPSLTIMGKAYSRIVVTAGLGWVMWSSLPCHVGVNLRKKLAQCSTGRGRWATSVSRLHASALEPRQLYAPSQPATPSPPTSNCPGALGDQSAGTLQVRDKNFKNIPVSRACVGSARWISAGSDEWCQCLAITLVGSLPNRQTLATPTQSSAVGCRRCRWKRGVARHTSAQRRRPIQSATLRCW